MISTVTQVPVGYKRTEVGLIPCDWDVRQVTDVCGFIVPGRNKPRVFEGDIPWVTTPDLTDGGSVSKSRAGLSITRAEAAAVGSKIVPGGSVLMSCAGELGIVAYVECDMVINQQLHAFIPTEVVSGQFLKFALKTRLGYIDSIATKTAVPYLNKDNCNSIQIPFPPLAEQEAIAEALGDADAWIESLEQLIAKKRSVKQAAMQQLLTGKTRLPGFEGEWRAVRLGDVASFFSGGTPSTSVGEYYGGNIPWITSSDLNRRYIYQVDGRISQAGFDASATKMVDENTLLIALYGATAGVTGMAMVSAAINQAVLAVIPFSDNAQFLFFKLEFLKDWLIETYTQGGQPNLSGQIIKSLILDLPSPGEQVAIASVLSDMDAEITSVDAKLAKARMIKQGMMQELLTGKTRLV